MVNSRFPDTFESLRAQAEDLLREGFPIDTAKQKSLSEIIHELNIHQAELEIQNRELQRSQYEYAQLHKEFSDLYEFAPFGYLTVNARHIISRANLTAVRLLGKTREQILRSGVISFISDDSSALAFTRARLRAVETGEKQSVEVPLKRRHGSPRWVRLDIEADSLDDDTDAQVRITLVDVTSQKEAEQKIRQAKEEWETTFDAISDIVTIQDTAMRIIRANKAAHETFQSNPGALDGRYCYEIFRGEDTPCPNCPVVTTMGDGKKHSIHITHKNLGKIFDVSSAPVLDSNGNFKYFVHIAKDITRQKKMEQDLFQARKMEAVGTLAGGVAHDFNNILSVILGHTELAKNKIPSGSNALIKHLDYVIAASLRAKELIQQILTFSRKGAEEKAPLRLSMVIKEGLNLLRASLPATVVLEEDIDSSCGYVMANATTIHQVLINLCINALHAMPNEKGLLTVQLRQVILTADDVLGQENVAPGTFIELSVSDTGCGMEQETIDRIFEPYFTTREFGKGSGIGLALVHGIVLGSGGFIKVESEPGQGSIFHVFFPAIEKEIQQLTAEAGEKPLPKTSGSILIVDDDESIVNLYKMILESEGYTVIGHCDSEKALEEIRKSPDRFDLVITDQTMPSISGIELSKKILEIRPEIPIILCTGYSRMIAGEKEAQQIGIKRFLMKPVRAKELTHSVQEVLQKAHP